VLFLGRESLQRAHGDPILACKRENEKYNGNYLHLLMALTKCTS